MESIASFFSDEKDVFYIKGEKRWDRKRKEGRYTERHEKKQRGLCKEPAATYRFQPRENCHTGRCNGSVCTKDTKGEVVG